MINNAVILNFKFYCYQLSRIGICRLRPLEHMDVFSEPTGRAKRRVYGALQNKVPNTDL